MLETETDICLTRSEVVTLLAGLRLMQKGDELPFPLNIESKDEGVLSKDQIDELIYNINTAKTVKVTRLYCNQEVMIPIPLDKRCSRY
jgi:hypothetical protein